MAILCLFSPSHGFGTLQKSMTVLFLDILRLFVIQKFLLHWGDKTPTPRKQQENTGTHAHCSICFKRFVCSSGYSISKMSDNVVRFSSAGFCNIFLVYFMCFYSKQLATPFASLQGRQYKLFLVWRIHPLLTLTQP